MFACIGASNYLTNQIHEAVISRQPCALVAEAQLPITQKPVFLCNSTQILFVCVLAFPSGLAALVICDLFTWDDILPDGPMHECLVTPCCHQSRHWGFHRKAEGGLGHKPRKTRCRRPSKRRPAFVPRELQTGQHRLRTSHPIRTVEDLPRVGWIAAIGIGEETPILMASYDIDLLNKFLTRVYEVARKRLLPCFPDDEHMQSLTQGSRAIQQPLRWPDRACLASLRPKLPHLHSGLLQRAPGHGT